MVGELIRFSAVLLSGSLPRQSVFHATLRSRLQVERSDASLPDDVFRLNLALESTQGALDTLTLMHELLQNEHPKSSLVGYVRTYSICRGRTISG